MPRIIPLSESHARRDDLEESVDQLTLHRLDHVRALLAEYDVPGRSGTRENVRRVMVDAIRQEVVPRRRVLALLDELDAWGNQRILLRRFDVDHLAHLATEKKVMTLLAAQGLATLVDWPIPLVPLPELTPVRIEYRLVKGGARLRLFAARTRIREIAVRGVEPRPDEVDPFLVYRPYRIERTKAVTHAEVDLRSGVTWLSVAHSLQAKIMREDIASFIEIFNGVLNFAVARPVNLYPVTKAIPDLPRADVRWVSTYDRTSVGGRIAMSSQSARDDIRSDPDLERARSSAGVNRNDQANCYWQQGVTLQEEVHTHIYADTAEITVFGNVREESVRHVLHRILTIAG